VATTRTYGDACAAAHALDLVGERWALLVVRELLLGPKRFTDLRTGLPQASPNVLSQRLRELEERGIVRRRKLGPPARAWVYELTAWGRELEAVVVQLGRWGSRSPFLTCDAEVGADAVILALRTQFDPDAAGDLSASYQLRLGDDSFSVRVGDGRLEAARGEPPRPDAAIHGAPRTFITLLAGRESLDELLRTGQLEVTGDRDRVERLLAAVSAPRPAPAP
jgi:DNA-binding HxlR family transcriptional regulator